MCNKHFQMAQSLTFRTSLDPQEAADKIKQIRHFCQKGIECTDNATNGHSDPTATIAIKRAMLLN